MPDRPSIDSQAQWEIPRDVSAGIHPNTVILPADKKAIYRRILGIQSGSGQCNQNGAADNGCAVFLFLVGCFSGLSWIAIASV
jgi:hypothetical protein